MSESFQPEVAVGSDAFVKALKHGVELWNDGSTPTFRLDQREGKSGFTRYCNARVEGKMAEEAFVTFLDEYYGITAAVDYDIYGDIEQTDNGDVKHILGDDGGEYDPSVEVDVKKTKRWNDWLALRRDVYEKQPEDAPFVLAKLSIEDDLQMDLWEDETWSEMLDDKMFETRLIAFAKRYFPLDVKMVGPVYKDEFTHDFNQGSRLHDPETGDPIGGPLRRENVGIPCRDIEATKKRWDRVISDITADIPVEYDNLSDRAVNRRV